MGMEVCGPEVRFAKGDVVYLRSDRERQWPMTVVAVGAGYCEIVWLDEHGALSGVKVPEEALKSQ